jgi:hypothetical protein
MTNDEKVKKLVSEGVCPVCQNKLSHKEGCVECEGCGWSLCEEA